MSDWERANRDLLAPPEAATTPAPPPYPRRDDLIEFYVGPTTSFRYFIDSASLNALWKQGEIRYVLVARSPSGVDNVSFEGLRCAGQSRIFATGNTDGTWSVRPTEWRDLPRQSDVNAAARLRRQYFCPHNDPIKSKRYCYSDPAPSPPAADKSKSPARPVARSQSRWPANTPPRSAP